MSISNFQEKAAKTGCFQIVFFVCAAVLVGGMFYQGCGAKNTDDRRANLANESAVKVGSIDVKMSEVDQAIQASLTQMRDQRNIGPDAEAYAYVGALNKVVRGALTKILAQRNNIPIDDKAVLASLQAALEDGIEAERQKLAPTGTQKEFEDKFKAAHQNTPSELLKARLDEMRKNLDDPKLHDLIVADSLQLVVSNWYRTKVDGSEAAVRASYDKLTFKRIYLGPKDNDGTKALGDVKNNEPFEAVMNRYSKDPASAGKKVGDNTIDLPRSTITTLPEYEPLRSLKPNDTTGVIKVPEGFAIYKLISVKSDAPKDFESKKKKYISDYVSQNAFTKMDADLKALQKQGPITWALPGFAAMWDASEVFNSPETLDPTAMEKKAVDLFNKAKAISDKSTNPLEGTVAKLAAYFVIGRTYMMTANKDPLRKNMIWALEAVLPEVDTVVDRLRLVDMYIEEKNGPKAAENLIEALKANGQYDAEGQQNFGNIAAKAAAMRTAKLMSAEDDKAFQQEQQRWVQLKADEEKMTKESKAADEADRKKQEAESKKIGNAPATPPSAPAKDGSVTSNGITAKPAPKK